MGDKYIIELEEKPFHDDNGDFLYRVKGFNSLVFDLTGISKLTPYAEPDMEQVRKEAYDKGMGDAEMLAYKLYSPKIDEAYQHGLNDAWDAARKISSMDSKTRDEIFGEVITSNIVYENTASEAIEKIRQYEQEKDRQARIEFNCEEIKDVLSTTMKECNVSLDEIAAVLEKMRENK